MIVLPQKTMIGLCIGAFVLLAMLASKSVHKAIRALPPKQNRASRAGRAELCRAEPGHRPSAGLLRGWAHREVQGTLSVT